MAKKKEKASVPTNMVIGAFAGAASKTAVAPLERVRLLLQMAPARGEGSRSASSGFSAVMRSEGLAGLWRGNGLSIIRAMLSKGILFSSQDAFASKLSQTRTEPEPEPRRECQPYPRPNAGPEPHPDAHPYPDHHPRQASSAPIRWLAAARGSWREG